MAGIYVHIPFCKKRCHYCNFYSCVHTELLPPFIAAVRKEIEHSAGYLASDKNLIRTIYIGGGTPSLLSIQHINTILTTISKNFRIEKNPEITIEVNPDDVSIEYFKLLKDAGINRTSIGIQSFNDEYLKLMNRRHCAEQAFKSVEFAFKAGFDNISVDLIYGLPGMDCNEWQKSLSSVLQLPIKHLSAYHLGIEERTVFHEWFKKGKIEPVSEESSFEQFKMLNSFARAKGFEHYEISNLALPGYRSKHNSAYWDNTAYLGFGPAAHSYNKKTRKWNVAHVNTYIEKIDSNEKYWDIEETDPIKMLNEYLITHLRTNEGVDLKHFETTFGIDHFLKFTIVSQRYLNNGYAGISENKFILNLKGWFISDKIIADFMS